MNSEAAIPADEMVDLDSETIAAIATAPGGPSIASTLAHRLIQAEAEAERLRKEHVNIEERVSIRAVYRERDDYGEGPVIEFRSEGPDSATFLALDEETWKTLGRPQAVNIYVDVALSVHR